MADRANPAGGARGDPLRARRALLTTAGVVVAVACVVFVGRRLAREWDAAEAAIRSATPGWIVLAVVLAAAAMTAIALGWWRVLAALDIRRRPGRVTAWYFAGEIGKYLPGTVWPIIGRGELARRGGVDGRTSYSSVALSLGLLYLACAAVACVVLPFALDDAGWAALVLLAPLGLVALHPRITGPVARRLRIPVPGWGASARLVVTYVPAWLLVASATWAVARALDSSAAWPEVAFAATVSWLAGFLAVPVPGGVGVREAVFVALAGDLGPGVAESAAVAARLVFVAVDVAGALLSAGAARPRPSSTAGAGAPP